MRAAVKYFDLEFDSEKQPADLLRDCLITLNGELAANGYMLTSQSDVAVTYHRKYRHWGVILIAIVFFPIGLLALLITDDATITATVEPGSATGGARLSIAGQGPKNVRRGFEEMQI
jgi:hypothetical protein